uniref:Ubiquitin-60S ribosomal protein L40-like n=1 Tax=Acanthochromis polyacanthus TaxID=80966 RepID=A0A3Q1EJZ8_9TELE
MPRIYQVVVHGLRGEKMIIDLCNTEEQMKSMTVLQLKKKIFQKLPEGVGSDDLRLIFGDQALDEDSTLLCKYGVQHLSTIHIVIKVPGGGFPEKGDGGMGDKDKSQSMEKLAKF